MLYNSTTVTETFTGEPLFRKVRTPHGLFIKCVCGWWADGPFASRGEAVAAWCVHAIIHERPGSPVVMLSKLLKAVGPVVPIVIPSGGHCGHAPHCLNLGAMDDRDPMGCCYCGDRFRETFTPDVVKLLLAVAEAADGSGYHLCSPSPGVSRAPQTNCSICRALTALHSALADTQSGGSQ